jgi:S1-C subfamily serine protease
MEVAADATGSVIETDDGRELRVNARGRAVVTRPGTDSADAKRVVVTKVLHYSAAALLGLQPGDIITSMNDIPVRDIAEYNRVLQEACAEGFWAAYTREGRNFETVWIDRVR